MSDQPSIDQNQTISCELHLDPSDGASEEQAADCTCHSESECTGYFLVWRSNFDLDYQIIESNPVFKSIASVWHQWHLTQMQIFVADQLVRGRPFGLVVPRFNFFKTETWYILSNPGLPMMKYVWPETRSIESTTFSNFDQLTTTA